MQPITQNKKRIKVQHIVGNGTAQVDIVRNIQLPARARKIVDIHAEIVELDYEIIPNKVIVKGALHKQIYYVEEGDYVVKEFTIMPGKNLPTLYTSMVPNRIWKPCWTVIFYLSTPILPTVSFLRICCIK